MTTRTHATLCAALLAMMLAGATGVATAATGSPPPAGTDAGSGARPGPAADASVDHVALAGQALDQLVAGEYAALRARFTPAMQQALGADALAKAWESLPTQLGTLRARGAARVSSAKGHAVVVVPLDYERGALEAVISFDEAARIAGLLLRPPTAAPPPPSAVPDGLREQEVRVSGDGGDAALPGTLSLPAGAGPFPGVVLVHGSGPQDRDETIGGNRPFRDIAHGLALRGVAVLRYDKRTHVDPGSASPPGYGVDDEVTRDAVSAIATLRQSQGVDPARVHVLGHSLGAMLAPRIARNSGDVAGVVMLAAPSRPLLDIVAEQMQRAAAREGGIDAGEQAQLDALAADIAAVRAGGDQAVLGAPGAYWRSTEAIDAVADADALALPMLLLHGGRDIQVVAADWARWQHALGGEARATLREYPALNHLGIAGTGPGTPAEYLQPGHVDATLIDDIAAWITSQPGQGTIDP